MREALLILIMLVLLPVSLFNARMGIIGYVWFAIMRPDYLAWSAGTYPFSLALALCTLVGSLRYAVNVMRWFLSPLCALLLAFVFVEGVSVFAAYDPNLSIDPYLNYLRVILMVLLVPMLVDTFDYLRWLLLAMAFAIGFLGIKFGLFGLVNGGVRLNNGLGGLMSDNNDLALGLAMGVPLCWYAVTLLPKDFPFAKMGKLMFFGMLFCSMAGVVWTYSRGGLLSMTAGALAVAWRTRHKVTVLVLLAILSLPAIYMVQDSYFSRIGTMAAVTGDSQLEASAASRITLAKGAFKMWMDYPLTGVGFGTLNFRRLMPNYTDMVNGYVAHNTYMQVLADSGFVAFLLHVLILFGTIVQMGRAGKRMKEKKFPLEVQVVPYAIQSSLIAFAVGSTFLSRAGFDFYYFLVMAAASWHLVEPQLMEQYQTAVGSETAEALPAPVPTLPTSGVLPGNGGMRPEYSPSSGRRPEEQTAAVARGGERTGGAPPRSYPKMGGHPRRSPT